MDQESIVYGVVRDIAYGTQMEKRLRRIHNHKIIESLPDAEGWPFISREMFSVSAINTPSALSQTQIIHFGASYLSIEYEWQMWMKKFEALLMTMYWVNAKVHLETETTGLHTFIWESINEFHQPGEALQVRCEWQREGGVIPRR